MKRVAQKRKHFKHFTCENQLVLEIILKKQFPFKSIATDGGSEFMDFDGIEKNRDGEKRTELYFAHPHCASERGTENFSYPE